MALTLTAALNDADQAFLLSGTPEPTAGDMLQIDAEVLLLVGAGAHDSGWRVETIRGYNTTTPAAHSQGATAYQVRAPVQTSALASTPPSEVAVELGLTATAAELNTLAGVTAGTVAAGKAIVTTTNKHIDALVITDGGLALGADAGTAISSTAAELNLLDGATAPPVQVAERTFTETAGTGVYTATVAIPAGATVLDVIWRNTVVWNAGTSASLVVGDDDDANGYIEATDVLTAPIADVNGAGAGISTRLSLGATVGAYKGGGGRFCATAKTITATVTTVSAAAGTTGRSRLLVEYALPSVAAASKA
jgi:hypothetical protein